MFFRGVRGSGLSFTSGGLRLAFGVAIAAWAVVGISAGPALAKSKSFTSAGCSTWKVPAGVSSVTIQATGSAGQAVNGGLAPGGTGDVVSGTLSGANFGQVLDICVNSGGGGAGGGLNPTDDGGAGGGASGVALGGDFSAPVLIAGGGGGGAVAAESGGGAGLPDGVAGTPPSPCGTLTACGGGGGTQTAFGGGGAGDCGACAPGMDGTGFTSAGPGSGGAGGSGPLGGGGGGGGYYGGGGGGSGGLGADSGAGGGGSDFCASSLAAPLSLNGCKATGTNATYGRASVVLTYRQAAWARDFRDLLVDSRGLGPGETLVHKVKLAKSKYMSGDVSGSCRTLDGYIREVHKQTGTTITQAQARDLIEDARETQKAIGCSGR
jgi:hypothetical protein